MATRFYLALILITASAFGADATYDMLRLRPTTLPATGSEGMFRVSTTTKKLNQWNTAVSAWKEISGTGGGGMGRNLIEEPGFEDGGLAWTASGGSFTMATSGSNLLFDLKSGLFNASATGQTVCSDAVAIPNGFAGSNAMASAYFLTAATDYLFYAFDGSDPIGESKLITPSTEATQQAVNFIWPTSGNVQFCVESQSNAGDLAVDDASLGAATNLILVGRPMVGFKAMDATPSAAGFGGADPMIFSSLGTYGYDTHGGYDTGTGLYTVKVSGKYFVHCKDAVSGTYGANSYNLLHILKGASVFGSGGSNLDALNTTGRAEASGTIDLVVGDTIQCNPESSATSPSFVALETENFFEAYLIQPSDQIGLIAEDGWYVSATTGGADPSLGTATVGALQGIADSGLTLTADAGSLATEVPCSSTNPSSGTTCSAGNEQIGVAFTPTKSGHAEVCFDFSVSMQFTGGGAESFYASFVIVQTANNSQTIDAQATAAAEASWSGNTNEYFSTGRRACGSFNVTKNVKQTFRLFYKQTVSGTPTAFNIRAIQNPGSEQSNVRVTARLLDAQIPMPIIVSGVSTSNTLQSERINRVRVTSVCSSDPCTIADQSGNWVSAINWSSTGIYIVNFVAGVFSSGPTCTYNNGDGFARFNTHANTNGFTLNSYNAAGTLTDSTFEIICIGPR